MKRHAITLPVLLAFTLTTGAQAIEAPAAPVAPPAPDTSGWIRLIDGSNIAYDPNAKGYPQELQLNNGTTLLKESWDGYLRNFVGGLPPSRRATVLDALTRYDTEYDKVDAVIRFDPAQDSGGPYDSKSFLGVVGSMAPRKAVAALLVYYYGDSPLGGNRIKVVTDGAPREFGDLAFRKETDGTHTWEYCYLPLADEAYENLARHIIRSRQATMRIYGGQFYTDVDIDDRMRRDMHAMLMAVDAVNSLREQPPAP